MYLLDGSFDNMVGVEISFNDQDVSFSNSIEIEQIIENLESDNSNIEKGIQEKK